MSTRLAYRTCPLCEAACGLQIEIEEERVKRIRGDRLHVLSAGFICPKGSTLKQLHEDPDRLRAPLIRGPEGFKEVSWDEAFAEIDRRLSHIFQTHGRDSVAIYVGNPNAHHFENTLALRPLIKALASRNVFSASTMDQMPKQVACAYMFGKASTIPVPDLDRTDFLLMLGANPYESNGSLCTAPDFPGRMQAIRQRGGEVVVVDPRRTKTAANADWWIPIRPGTDAALLLSMVHVILQSGSATLGHLESLVNGFGALGAAVDRFSPEVVAPYAGIPASIIRDLAKKLIAAKTAVVYGRIGTHTVSFGTVASWAVDVLNLITGNLDRPGGAMFPRAAHSRAHRSARGFAPGRWQSRVRQLPEILGELPVVTMADEIETPGEGQVRALITVAGNPVLTVPESGRLDRAISSLDFMVSVDPYLNETTRHADVVLPPPSALERPHYDLAFTGLSVRNYAAYSPEVFTTNRPSEFEILVRLTAIAAGMGSSIDSEKLAEATLLALIGQAVGDADSPIFGRSVEEIALQLAGRPANLQVLDFTIRTGHRGDGFGSRPEGLSLQKLEADPHGIDLGALESVIDQILSTPSGKIELAPEPIIADLDRLQQTVEQPRSDDLVLVGRRQMRSANSWLHNVELLVRGKERCTLEVNPADAFRLGLIDGSKAAVVSRVGSLEVAVEVTEDISPGVVSIPYGWGHDLTGMKLSVASAYPGVNVNLLTDAGPIDPLSGNAVLNGIPVTVTTA